jgi:hypothetical protein
VNLDTSVNGPQRPLKKFLASGGVHVGSSGFANYIGPSDVPGALERVWEAHPDAIVVDGDDDWKAPKWRRPESLARDHKLRVLALFHSGISGISSSGVVLDRAEYDRLRFEYQEVHGKDIEATLRVYGAHEAGVRPADTPRRWRGTCTCGWRGLAQTKLQARKDATDHETSADLRATGAVR